MLPQDVVDTVQQQYRSKKTWATRQAIHEKYTHPKQNFSEWVMNLYPWQGQETVLDIGCGPGRYQHFFAENHKDVRYYGLDYSYAMLETHPTPGQITRGTMQQLPFADNTFEVVMANHVMYLAPDINATIQEIRRVMKPGGVMIAATTSTTSTPQFRELFRRAILLVSAPGRSREVIIPETLHGRFALENGSHILSKHFYAVVRYDLPSAFVFPEVDPIMDYLEATRAIREPQLPEGVTWDQVMLIMREQISNLIISLNALVVDKLTGVLMATDEGGFIRPFVEIQQAEATDN
jgi:SAM-dependent methyltransferase